MKETLEQTIPNIGTLHVYLNRLSHDKYNKFCLGRRITVRFESLPGDHPLLVVDHTHLSGDNLQVTVYEVTISDAVPSPVVVSALGPASFGID